MTALFRVPRSTVRRPRVGLSVTALEVRNVLATGLPPVNLSAATVHALGQALANLATQVDGANAATDLNNAATAIQNDLNFLLAHPSRNPAVQTVLLQLDVDTLAVVDQAIADLTPPPPAGGGGAGLPAA
jgi:hypothetical protein